MNLKKNGNVFTSKFVGTGPSSYKKKNLLARGLTKVEKHYSSFSREADVAAMSSCTDTASGTRWRGNFYRLSDKHSVGRCLLIEKFGQASA